jgi:hypothetical protein
MMEERAGRPWHVFATYLAAVAGIFATTAIAVETLHSLYPDVPTTTLVRTLPGLLAGSLAASSALLLTLMLSCARSSRPLPPAAGRESGSTLLAAVVGLRGAEPGLDSLTRAGP